MIKNEVLIPLKVPCQGQQQLSELAGLSSHNLF